MKDRIPNHEIEEIKRFVKDIKKNKSSYGSAMTDFQVIKEIGRGSYGTVYKVQSQIDNRSYALKKIEMKHLKTKHQLSALKEVKILK
jgi:serine/threonine protein kinase